MASDNGEEFREVRLENPPGLRTGALVEAIVVFLVEARAGDGDACFVASVVLTRSEQMEENGELLWCSRGSCPEARCKVPRCCFACLCLAKERCGDASLLGWLALLVFAAPKEQAGS